MTDRRSREMQVMKTLTQVDAAITDIYALLYELVDTKDHLSFEDMKALSEAGIDPINHVARTILRAEEFNRLMTVHTSVLSAELQMIYILKGAGHGDTAEGILKEIINEYDVFKALIGPFMDDEGCYCDAKVSLQDLYLLDTKIDKARAFLDKQTESNDEDEEED